MRQKRIGREVSCLKNLFSRNIENNDTVRFVNELTSANAHILRFLAKNQNTDIYQKTIEENFSITKSTTSKMFVSLHSMQVNSCRILLLTVNILMFFSQTRQELDVQENSLMLQLPCHPKKSFIFHVIRKLWLVT